MTDKTALVVDPDADLRDFICGALSRHGLVAEPAENAAGAERALAQRSFDLIVTNTKLPDQNGGPWIEARRQAGDTIAVLFIAWDDDATLDIDGATDESLLVPFSVDQLLGSVSRALGRRQAPTGPTRRQSPHSTAEVAVHQIGAMEPVFDLVRRVAKSATTVLLEGESGTGKEVMARCIHEHSGRDGRFVPIDCSAISADLLESELFGHIRGAFTGASQQREGVFIHANGGTLLLDEICEMPLNMQAKLLRALEERAIRPVGAEDEHPVNVQIVAATNRSMAEEVETGRFRADLYHRLNVLAIRLPPLRERTSDIPALIRLFADNLSRELQLPPPTPSAEALQALQDYPWPGNVRELKNTVERAILLDQPLEECLGAQQAVVEPAATGTPGYPTDLPMADVERMHMHKVLQETGGNKSEAARRLGVSRKTLERKVRQWSTYPAQPPSETGC